LAQNAILPLYEKKTGTFTAKTAYSLSLFALEKKKNCVSSLSTVATRLLQVIN